MGEAGLTRLVDPPERADQKQDEPIISVVLPCLNEEQTIVHCVRQAQEAFARAGIRGEVIVVDNASDDRSAELAISAGARVVYEPDRGYGNACRKGLQETGGRYIVIADADGTYDLSLLQRFVEPLQQGYDLVLGTRLQGEIQPGAMPWLHRHIGVPLLTSLLNRVAGTRVSDAHCGMRALTRPALTWLDLKAGGMEFASELILKGAEAGLKITEVAIPYLPRQGVSKLHRLRDGWRHLRLLFSSRLLRLLTFLAHPCS